MKSSPYILQAEFNNSEALQNYVSNLFVHSTLYSNMTDCTLCNKNDHKMRSKISFCRNTACSLIETCSLKYKTLACSSGKSAVYVSGVHNSELNSSISAAGINKKVKDVIDKLIEEHEGKPKRSVPDY